MGWAKGWSAADAYKLASFEPSTGIYAANIDNAMLYPNPASSYVRLAFSLESSDKLNIQIVDVTGKVVLTVASTTYASGMNNIDINTSTLKSGVYFVNMNSEKSFFTQRLVIE